MPYGARLPAVSMRGITLHVRRFEARILGTRSIDLIQSGQDLPGQVQALCRVRQRDVGISIERIGDAFPQLTTGPSALPRSARVPERQFHPTLRDRNVNHRGKLPVAEQEALLGTRWAPVRLLAQVNGVVLGKFFQKRLRSTPVALAS